MTEDKRKEMELLGNVAQLFMKFGIKSLTMDEIASASMHKFRSLQTRSFPPAFR